MLKNDQVQSIAKSIVQTDLLFRKQAELEKELTRVRQELSSKSEYSFSSLSKFYFYVPFTQRMQLAQGN